MGTSQRHKVCFPIAGRPAINRSLDVYKNCGIATQVVVVGAMGGQVVETIAAEHPDAVFAFQTEQLGTGHAAKAGAEALRRLGYEGDVLVTMGDKLVDPAALEQLIDEFYRSQADLAMLAAPKSRWPHSGRLVCRSDGTLAASVEWSDIARGRLLDRLRNSVAKGKPVGNKALRRMIGDLCTYLADYPAAFGGIAKLLTSGKPIGPKQLAAALPDEQVRFTLDQEQVDGAGIEARARQVNVSVYLFRFAALKAALRGVTSHPWRHEQLLTDAVTVLGQARNPDGSLKYRLRVVQPADPNLVLGFNNPRELVEAEDLLRRRQPATARAKRPRVDRRLRRPVRQWLKLFDASDGKVDRVLKRIYGPAADRIRERRRAFTKVLRLFGKRFGPDREVYVVRAPGRINLMGRHIDHRGGSVNVMAIDREVIMVAEPRADDDFVLLNTQPDQFPDRRFSLGQYVANLNWEDWQAYVDSDQVLEMVRTAAGDWSNYVKAAVLRLQASFRNIKLQGMNVAAGGNIPVASGLSSSSAVVVAAAECAVLCNGLEVAPPQLVDLCGEGEWFVGSRGGAADHAGIRLSQRGSLSQVDFFPFRVGGTARFPRGYRVVVCGSHVKAEKSAGARDTFNQRIACYEIGFAFLRDKFAQYRHLLAHLRDVNRDRLGTQLRDIYSMLMQVPERVTKADLGPLLSADSLGGLQPLIRSHAPRQVYTPRGVVLFGLAEIERARICVELLKRGDVAGFGRLMKISHDGDRVVRFDATGEPIPFHAPISDSDLATLVDDLASEDPERVHRGQLYRQPGGYACSTPELDRMVDTAVSVPGVAGAQMAGAGLGGCIMVLCADDAVTRLKRALSRHYYRPSNLPAAVWPCTPVAGAGALRI